MLDTKRIRTATPAQLRDYYNELLKFNLVETVTPQLLQAIERGSIPPITFAPWLGVSKSSTVVREALKQNKSVLVRKFGIKQLRLSLCSSRWKETWEGIGGTAGVLEIFSDLSVLEIRQSCKALGSCARGKDLIEKRECYSDLFMGLHPSAFPDAEFRTTDRRPLAKYYGLLAPACSEDLVNEAAARSTEGVWRHARARNLLRYHPESMRRKHLQYLSDGHTKAINEEELKSLFREYPSTKAPERGFSASMDFALTVLRTLAESESSQLDEDFFIDDLVRPLLRRAVKKRAKWEKIQDIVNLMMQYLEARPTAGKSITTAVDDVRHLVAQCWSRKPQLFEKQLRRLCSHPVFGTSKLDELGDWEIFLQRILPARRYSLLRLVFRESTGLDIDSDAHVKEVKGFLSHDLLNNLGAKEALSLFNRLREVRGNEDLVEIGNSDSVLSITSTYEGLNGDPDLYNIVLQRRSGNDDEAEKLARGFLQIRKKQATSASQPEQRGFYAKSALFGAIGSGSLMIYQETTEWTKRFLRDPLANQQIHPRYYPKEASRLLSGVPYPLESLTSMLALRRRVEKANALLVSLFDIACAAMSEPSFYIGDWEGILDLFFSVIQHRIDLSPNIKKMYQATDEDLYHSLWEATVPMLISVEEKANQEGFKKLEAHGLRGILGQSLIELRPKDTSTVTFLDNLAKARDELWRKLRPELYPAAAALPAPFPHGLPIQHLTAPWSLNVENLETCAPYLSSRVQAALFPDPTAALSPIPTEDESQKAIGLFVDSYRYALQLHVPDLLQRAETEARVNNAWSFAYDLLSQGRMDGGEAFRYLKDQKPGYLKAWPPRDIAPENHAIWPLIPETDFPLEPMEWNPFTSGRPNNPARHLRETTYMDLSLVVLEQTPYQLTVHRKFGSLSPKIPAFEDDPDTIWDSSRNIGEGGVLSALLYLDSRYVSDNHLLERPFPSEDEPRYPFLYLNDEFLLSEGLNPLIAVRNIRGHLNAIPPAILAQLARSTVKALDTADINASTYVVLHEVTMLLIVRLSECDRPDLATMLAIRTILHRPKSSSWHRQLLKPSFLRRLTASDAQNCIEEFASHIFRRLVTKDNEAKESENSEGDAESHARPGQTEEHSKGTSIVKVTTQKLLAQLFQGTEFVGGDYARSVLLNLHQKTAHVAVHLNVIKALLSILQVDSTERFNDLLAALEPMVLLAASLNERKPLTDVDWARSEETLSLPELEEGISSKSDTTSPILAALFSHFRNAQSDSAQLKSFVIRIILPIFSRLKQQTARWVALFLRKYGIDDATQKELHIPSIPRDPSVIRMLLSAGEAKVCYLPGTVLEEYVAYITFNIAPSAPIRELNKRLREGPALKSQTEVKTWLRLYGQGLDVVKELKTFDLASRLGVDVKAVVNAGVTPKVVQEQLLKLFTAVLWNDSPTYTVLEECLTHGFLKGDYLTKPWWQPYGRPVIEAMISYVNTIRTRDWERDPKRKPAVLPDIFPWRLLLLDYPWPNRDDKAEDRDKVCKAFANRLATIIDEIAGSRYHKKLSQLKSYLALDPVSSTGDRSTEKKIGRWTLFYDKHDPLHDALMHVRVLTAIYLGDISKTRLSWLTAPDLLKVDVASHLVESVGELEEIDKALKLRLEELLETWTVCENEDVRRTGAILKEKYFPNSG